MGSEGFEGLLKEEEEFLKNRETTVGMEKGEQSGFEMGQGLGDIDAVEVGVDLGEMVLDGVNENGGEIVDEDLGMEILLDGMDGKTGEILELETAFESFVMFLDAPSLGVEIGKKGGWEAGGFEKGRGEDFDFAGAEFDAEKPDGDWGDGKTELMTDGFRGFVGMEQDGLIASSGTVERTDGVPGLRRDAGTELCPASLEPSEEPESGVTAIQEDEIVGREDGAMVESQLEFADRIGSDAGIQGEMIEEIVDLGDTRHDTGEFGRSLLVSEMRTESGVGRKTKGGAIESEKAKAVPGTDGSVLNEPGDQVAVEFLEGLGIEFRAGLGERGFGDESERGKSFLQSLKEGVQFGLNGRFELMEEKQDHQGQGQNAIPNELVGRQTVTGNKIVRIQNIFQKNEKLAQIFKRISCQFPREWQNIYSLAYSFSAIDSAIHRTVIIA